MSKTYHNRTKQIFIKLDLAQKDLWQLSQQIFPVLRGWLALQGAQKSTAV